MTIADTHTNDGLFKITRTMLNEIKRIIAKDMKQPIMIEMSNRIDDTGFVSYDLNAVRKGHDLNDKHRVHKPPYVIATAHINPQVEFWVYERLPFQEWDAGDLLTQYVVTFDNVPHRKPHVHSVREYSTGKCCYVAE